MRILHAIHDFLPRHQAGSEIYVLNLSRAQRALGLHTHVLCADDDRAFEHGSFRWRVHEGTGVTELINNWAFPSFRDSYRSPLLNRQLRDLLTSLAPDVLHIHNLLNLSFDLPIIARDLGIPTVATLHDYTLVCASGGQRVHEAEEHVCTLIDTRRCSRCYAQHNFHARSTFGPMAMARVDPANPVGRAFDAARRRAPGLFDLLTTTLATETVSADISPGRMDERLDDVQRVFEATDLFVAPSPHLGTEYVRLGLPVEKLRVSDYGFIRFVPLTRPPSPDRLRIGFVGTLVWHKGAHVLLEAVRLLPEDRFEVLVFGDTSTFPDYMTSLREGARGLPVRFMGRFERDRLPEVYASVDVLVVPSLWPENSPLVIHEAFMAGVPVVGSRHGGTQDLVTHDVNGLLYDALSASSLASALRSLIDEPDRLARLSAAVPEVKSIHENAKEFESIYSELVSRRPSARVARAVAAARTTAIVVNDSAPDDALLALRSLQASRSPVHRIIVVDVGPEQEGSSALADWVAADALIVTAHRLGNSAACNLGIRQALALGADRVLILKGDAVLSPDALQQLESALDANARLGVVGPAIRRRGDPGVLVSSGIRLSAATGGIVPIGAGERVAPPSGGRTTIADAVTGEAMLVRREVFERVGLLSEDYYQGLQDVDLCVRARTAGFESACVESATALSGGRPTTVERMSNRVYFASRNHLLLASRLSGRGAPHTWIRASRIVLLHCWNALFQSGVPAVEGLRAVAEGVRDHLKLHYGPSRMTDLSTRREPAGPDTVP